MSFKKFKKFFSSLASQDNEKPDDKTKATPAAEESTTPPVNKHDEVGPAEKS